MNTKKKSMKQEKRVAKEIGGKTVIASGAFPTSKGDAISDVFLVECKTTHSDAYTLNYATWVKIKREALNEGMREPLMSIDLEDGKKRLAVFDRSSWQDFFDWLPKSLEVDTAYCDTYGATKQLKWDDGSVRFLTYRNKFVLNDTNRKDIELCVAPWDLFMQYFDYTLKIMDDSL